MVIISITTLIGRFLRDPAFGRRKLSSIVRRELKCDLPLLDRIFTVEHLGVIKSNFAANHLPKNWVKRLAARV
jgi:hypothetical protein